MRYLCDSNAASRGNPTPGRQCKELHMQMSAGLTVFIAPTSAQQLSD